MKKNLTNEKLKDISRFNRWLKDFDEKDKTLNTKVRKRKWMLIVTGIFFLFVLSFILFPASRVNTEKLGAPISVMETSRQETSVRSAFELPVDSFENHLKIIVDENIPEKE